MQTIFKFYKFPKPNSSDGTLQTATAFRLGLWIQILGKQHLSMEELSESYICYKHFHSGKPAEDGEFYDPDYLPTRLLQPATQESYFIKWSILFENAWMQWIAFVPKAGQYIYPCYACRDFFGNKTSFLEHINRRSLLLKYQCLECQTEIIFYNPCAFILHASQHVYPKSVEIDLDCVTITMILFDAVGYLPHEDFPDITYLGIDDIDQGINLKSNFYMASNTSRGKQIVHLIPQQFDILVENSSKILILKQKNINIPYCKFLDLRNNIDDQDVINKDQVECPECKNTFLGKIQDHIASSDRPFDELLKCHLCKYLAASTCSLKAYVRTHQKKPPFVCPECGEEFLLYIHLSEHLDNICFHPHKSIRYKCPAMNCSKIFAYSAYFVQHFKNHLETYSVCNKCQNKFRNQSDFKLHSGCDGKSFLEYRCNVCKDNKIFFKNNYIYHVNLHCQDINIRFYVWICKYCKCLFRQKGYYATHMHSCCKLKEYNIKELKQKELSSNCDTLFCNLNCLKCSELILKEDIEKHVCNSEKSKQNTSAYLTCVHCCFKTKNRDQFISHIHLHKSDFALQCLMCGDFQTTKWRLLKHIIFSHRVKNAREFFSIKSQSKLNYLK
ncbi:PREDICTED: zinc finger protein 532-like, partial [Nicrophorus vespilloides]|uniref:Zinc finger protein 532-like n=1 Tax=Nicrophorus vespilloides TaxID=110193 RepID=A0ABM1MUZ1_NICVS